MSYPQLDKFMRRHGTSFYLFYPERFCRNLADIQGNLTRIYANSLVSYAYKANYMPILGGYLAQQGVRGEVVSGMEYNIARIHLPGEHIIFNGPCKSLSEISRAVDEGALVNIDSFQEIQLLEKLLQYKSVVEVGLRVNFDIGTGHSRFGFSYEDGDVLRAAERLCASNKVRIVSLHSHFTTRERSLELFKRRTEGMLAIYNAFPYKKDIKFLNLGGGFFGPMSVETKSKLSVPVPTFAEYAQVIAGEFYKVLGGDGPTLVIEPGVSMIADSMEFVAQVLDKKKVRGKTILTIDGSTNILYPTASRYALDYKVVSKNQDLNNECCDVTGYTCMESDVLLSDVQIAAEPGDFIVFKNRGAYSNVYKPPFIKAAPAIIGLNGEVFARPQSFEDVIAPYNLSCPPL